VKRSFLAALILLLSNQSLGAQLSYTKGQNVSPGYEGWEQNEDGSFNLLFGYMNRNWLEEVDAPIGPGNMLSPGPADQGQPTHFLPRRNRFIFKVRVPADWGDKEMVWTLTTHGRTEYAYASLRTDYRVDNMVISSETGALGAGSSSPESRMNVPPVVRIVGDRELTARVGQPLTLVAEVTDDDLPRRRGARAAAARAAAAAAAEASDDASPSDDAAADASLSADATDDAVTDDAVTDDAVTDDATADDATADDATADDATADDATADDATADEAEEDTGPKLSSSAMRPPSRVTVGKRTGLHLSWFVYRGPESVDLEDANVTFRPLQVKVWEDTRTAMNSPWAPLWSPPDVPEDGMYEVRVTFDQPGTYVLRGRADDGALYHDQDVTVHVTTLLP
jgi:hypothetical protein